METVHAIMLIIHVLGAALIVGVAFVTFVIELRHLASKQFIKFVELIWNIIIIAMITQLLSGIYLAASQWDEIGVNGYFWVKMGLLLAGGVLVGVINRRRFRRMRDGKGGQSTSWALIGLLLFVAIASLGVMVSETHGHDDEDNHGHAAIMGIKVKEII